MGYEGGADLYPGDAVSSGKYVHCVENGASAGGDSRVVVEWGPASGPNGASAVDLLLRYRCPSFPQGGEFYLLIYDDPFQAVLHEVGRKAACCPCVESLCGHGTQWCCS